MAFYSGSNQHMQCFSYYTQQWAISYACSPQNNIMYVPCPMLSAKWMRCPGMSWWESDKYWMNSDVCPSKEDIWMEPSNS